MVAVLVFINDAQIVISIRDSEILRDPTVIPRTEHTYAHFGPSQVQRVQPVSQRHGGVELIIGVDHDAEMMFLDILGVLGAGTTDVFAYAARITL